MRSHASRARKPGDRALVVLRPEGHAKSWHGPPFSPSFTAKTANDEAHCATCVMTPKRLASIVTLGPVAKWPRAYPRHLVLVAANKYPCPRAKTTTRSLNSSAIAPSSPTSPRAASETSMRVGVASVARRAPPSPSLRDATTEANATAPDAPAPAAVVPSLVHATRPIVPAPGAGVRSAQNPRASARNTASNPPATRCSPFGAHATDAIGERIWRRSPLDETLTKRPVSSQTLNLPSSPPDAIKPFVALQSHARTTPSCARHLIVLRPASSGFTKRSRPHPNASADPSPRHDAQYVAASLCSTADRSSPARDHVRTAPSSPAVTRAVPSGFQRTLVTAPRCASATRRSTRPERWTIANAPSLKASAKTSLAGAGAGAEPGGNQCMSTTYPSRSHTCDGGGRRGGGTDERRGQGV